MLKYPEVCTNLVFTSISTLPLELQCTTKITVDSLGQDAEDAAFATSVSIHVRSLRTEFPLLWQHTYNEKLILDDLK